LSLGVFVVNTDLEASLNGQSVNNPEVDFDQTFGRDKDATRFRLDGLWRITPAHHLRLMYFNNSSERSRVIDKDLAWGDYTFKANGNVALKHEFEIFEVAYEYAFMRRPTYELAASVGVHYMDTTLQMAGTASFTDPAGNTMTASATSKASSLPAPLPVIGLRGGWVLHPDWYLDLQGQVFKVKVGDYDGYWSDLRAGVTWMFHRNFGLGLGYNRFTTNLDVAKSDFEGGLKTGYSGLYAISCGTQQSHFAPAGANG